jgi:hypothetical protein
LDGSYFIENSVLAYLLEQILVANLSLQKLKEALISFSVEIITEESPHSHKIVRIREVIADKISQFIR